MYTSILGFESLQSNLWVLVLHVLETASILHVALLVFLRLKAVTKPLTGGKNEHIVLISFVTVIWIISIFSCIIPVLVLAYSVFDTFRYVKMITFHCFGTFPVVSIIIMWGILLKISKDRRMKHKRVSNKEFISIEESNHSKMVKIVHRLVIALLICYIPFLFWKQYFYSVIVKRVPNAGYSKAVRFHFVVCQCCSSFKFYNMEKY